MDEDLKRLSREELIEEVKKLRNGIRQHRDSTRHELCWHHPALWGLLPEKTDPVPVVPDWPQFRYSRRFGLAIAKTRRVRFSRQVSSPCLNRPSQTQFRKV